MSLRELTRAHRSDLVQLTRLASNDLSLVWKQFNAPATARDGLMDVLPRLASVYGQAAATLGADWYDEMRDASGVGGRFTAITADLPDEGRTDALARWGVSPLFKADPDWESALTLVNGGMQRIIADADRGSVTLSSVADPKARGWSRTGNPKCDFCAMLIDRGSVYSEATADFQSHDNCHCLAVPEFG